MIIFNITLCNFHINNNLIRSKKLKWEFQITQNIIYNLIQLDEISPSSFVLEINPC